MPPKKRVSKALATKEAVAETIAPPFYPMIYVRGYAGNQSEVEDTTADPYMGFNIGSTKIRQLWQGNCTRFYFESPLVRLMKDYGYRDVYQSGDIMPQTLKIGSRSIFVYRYYERTSIELGDGKRLSIEEGAGGLSDLILQIRDRICGSDTKAQAGFRVYLVAHSMGGLVVRAFLQNPKIGDLEAKKAVDKAFTYATPHNGIDMQIIGNVPGFFTMNDVDNFNRDRMRAYLGLPKQQKKPDGEESDVDSLNGKFDPSRFFNLVGTNDKDYTVASGWSRRVVGPMSDGLVRIQNATTWGPYEENGERKEVNSPRALVHRSHSGHYGIVNSEEGYQNLTRFLFGDARVDGTLEVKDLTLPQKIQEAKDAGNEIRASYHFEVVVRVRGGLWDLHRRTVAENSAVFRKYDELFSLGEYKGKPPRHPQLFSLFLSKGLRVDTSRNSLGFSIDLGVAVPQYEVEKKLWFDDHFEGGYIFRDKINLEAIPPANEEASWELRYGFDSSTPNGYDAQVEAQKDGDFTIFRIPIQQAARPGIDAEFVLSASPWNQS